MKDLKQGDSCPKCLLGIMLLKVGVNYQPFLACDSFPDCRKKQRLSLEDYKIWLEKNKV